MRVTPDNIFPGAKITFGGEEFTVIKVNAKSFYCSKMSLIEFNEKFSRRFPGTTFVEFCKKNGVDSRKYTENFEIEENEFSRKLVAEKNIDKGYKFDKAEILAINDFIAFYKKKKKSLWLNQLMAVNKLVRFIEIKENRYLLNVDKNYVLADFELNEFVKISTVFDYRDKYKEVPWEKLSYFAAKEEVMTA